MELLRQDIQRLRDKCEQKQKKVENIKRKASQITSMETEARILMEKINWKMYIKEVLGFRRNCMFATEQKIEPKYLEDLEYEYIGLNFPYVVRIFPGQEPIFLFDQGVLEELVKERFDLDDFSSYEIIIHESVRYIGRELNTNNNNWSACNIKWKEDFKDKVYTFQDGVYNLMNKKIFVYQLTREKGTAQFCIYRKNAIDDSCNTEAYKKGLCKTHYTLVLGKVENIGNVVGEYLA